MTTPRNESPVGLPGFPHPPHPPRFPPPDASATTRAALQAGVRRLIGADRALALAVASILLCCAFPMSMIMALAVLAMRGKQLRLIDWYAGYFPGGYPYRRQLDVSWVLGIVGLVLAAAGWAVVISWFVVTVLG